jgi:hypothetical protein
MGALLAEDRYPVLTKLLRNRTARIRNDGAVIGQAANGQWKYLGSVGDLQVVEELVRVTTIEIWNDLNGSMAYEVDEAHAC